MNHNALFHQMVASALSDTPLGGNPKKSQRSRCGEDFDEYVFRGVSSPFPFSPVGAASRQLDDLWKNRRFKLHYHGKWREGKVIMWEQYNPTPHTTGTCWIVHVQLDTVEEGDEVELKLAGEVGSDLTGDTGGTAKVTSNMEAGPKDIHVKITGDTKIAPMMRLYVHRMNVHGGGTVKMAKSGANSDQEGGDETRYSLEWLGPALPHDDLNQDIMTFDCPCCRKAEPVGTAFADPSNTTTADCPVCMETTECRVLGCGHSVCHSCWNSCRLAATRVSVELDGLDEEEVSKERANRNRLYRRKRTRDGSQDDFVATFAELAESSTNRDGLMRLRWELMVEHPAVWSTTAVFGAFEAARLPKEALQVVYQVVQDRKDEIPPRKEGTEAVCTWEALGHCAFWIGKEVSRTNYRAAVPWAELVLIHTLNSRGEATDNEVGEAYMFTSRLYVLADKLTSALKHCDLALELLGEDDVDSTHHKGLILSSMNDWTGTSGKLTPGI